MFDGQLVLIQLSCPSRQSGAHVKSHGHQICQRFGVSNNHDFSSEQIASEVSNSKYETCPFLLRCAPIFFLYE